MAPAILSSCCPNYWVTFLLKSTLFPMAGFLLSNCRLPREFKLLRIVVQLRQMRQKLIWRGMQVIENMERETGLEPATSSLGSWHSTTELLPHSAIPAFNLFYGAYTSKTLSIQSIQSIKYPLFGLKYRQ